MRFSGACRNREIAADEGVFHIVTSALMIISTGEMGAGEGEVPHAPSIHTCAAIPKLGQTIFFS